MNFLNQKKIVLASKSPRRKMLLEQLGLDLQIYPSHIDESEVKLMNPEAYVKELALLKAENKAHANL